MRQLNVIKIIFLLIPVNLISQNSLVLGNSLDRFIMRPHSKVAISYGNTSEINTNYILTPKYLIGLNSCATNIILVNKFNGIIIDQFNLSSCGLTKFKQLSKINCKYNYLLNSVFIKAQQIGPNLYFFGIVKKDKQYHYLRIEIKNEKILASFDPLKEGELSPQITDEEKKLVDTKIFPQCFKAFLNCHYLSYDKNFFYYHGDPLRSCISNKKNKNDSLTYYYFETNSIYHKKNNKLTKIKRYHKKGRNYGIAEDSEYLYYHNEDNLLVIDRDGDILFDKKLNLLFKEKNISFKTQGYGTYGIYAISVRNHRVTKESKLTSDTIITEIFTLKYDPNRKDIVLNKNHIISSNYPIYCKQIDGLNYYFQYSFIGNNNNLYKIKLDTRDINIITKYPEKSIAILNKKKEISKATKKETDKEISINLENYLQTVKYAKYTGTLLKKSEKKFKNKSETQLIESILTMLNDTAQYENLFLNYVVYEKGLNDLRSDTEFIDLINKLKTEEYLFLIEELKEHMNSLIIKSNLIAEYENIKAYTNDFINKKNQGGIRFYPFLKLDDKLYIHLSSPIVENYD